LGEAAGGEDLSAPWSGVVETTCDHAAQAVAAEVLNGQGLLSNLAHRVGAQWPKRIALGDWRFVGIDQPVLLARAGNVHERIEVRLTDRLEQIDLRDDVVGQRGGRGRPAGGYEALRREMKDLVGLNRANDAADRAAIL